MGGGGANANILMGNAGDYAATLEARFTKICVREAGFFAYLPGVWENVSFSGKCAVKQASVHDQ